ncbi:MAG: hypothetical protein ABSH31_08325 [Bryobacteraceae bacterium]
MRIRDLLDRDFSKPIEEIVKVNNDDPETVFTELTEYIATPRITAEYEKLFSAMVAARQSPSEHAGVWISGFCGSGKSSFAKNLGYVLARREVLGASASSLFLKQVESKRVAECVQFLNQSMPYEIFMFDVQLYLPARTYAEHIAEVMYRVLLRDLDYAEDFDIAELEIELEKEGQLTAFQDLCSAEYQEEWRSIRKGGQNVARSSALLHRLDPRTYASTDTWLNVLRARPSRSPSVKDLVEKLFDLCAIRRPGKSFAFIVDEMGQYVAQGGERVENLRAVVEQFGQESLQRLKAGKIPGPAWIIATAQDNLPDIDSYFTANNLVLPNLQDRFKYQIDLSPAGIGEVATRRVLRKKSSRESTLRKLFRESGESLIENIKLEKSSRRTWLDEDQFVRYYPYLPHLIDLSIDILVGIERHPFSLKHLGGSNRGIIKQCFEMLVSDRTRLCDQPVGVLVSIDKIYDLVEANIPPDQHKNLLHIGQRFDGHHDYPGLASRIAKAVCLMEFAAINLPRTTRNIAALLVQRVTEAPPALAVSEILYLMKEARFIRDTKDGWTLYSFDELRREAASLEGLKNAVGAINPRLPGWHNDLIQLAKKLVARSLHWYTRPLQEFSTSVTRSIDEIVSTLDHLSTDTPDADHLSSGLVSPMDMVALEGRSALSEHRNAAQADSTQQQIALLHQMVETLINSQNNGNPEISSRLAEWRQRAGQNSRPCANTSLGIDRTAYLIGLFGTGRRYVNELILQNIGERAQYFRDTIRVHPGPTPMIYSGHATVKYPSRLQYQPTVTKRILEAVRSRFADLIFVYRHPLDSLLTNWVWWRSYIRDNRSISGISQIYKNTDELCADLERNFSDFEAFAAGDPDFFAGAPGPRFLSFSEFVEETELHLQSATLALRLEDFLIDPFQEFSKIAEVMSADLDLSHLSIAPPKTKPYTYLAVQDKVPQFRNFIHGLHAETKERIDKIGYKGSK